MPGRPTILITVGQGPAAHAVGAGGGCLAVFIRTTRPPPKHNDLAVLIHIIFGWLPSHVGI